MACRERQSRALPARMKAHSFGQRRATGFAGDHDLLREIAQTRREQANLRRFPRALAAFESDETLVMQLGLATLNPS